MKNIKAFAKENLKFILFVVVSDIMGGYFTALHLLDTLSPEMLEQIDSQEMSRSTLTAVTAVQVGFLYGALLSVIGIILSKKIGLWKEIRFEKKAMAVTLAAGVLGGLLLYPGDNIIFGSFSDFVREQYTSKPSLNFFMCGILYGGIIEEVIMRLFFMSLLAFIIYKIFYRKESEVPVKVLIISNIIASVAFSAGHIPSTMGMTELTAALLIRCFTMNGAYGLVFGYLYRKYGIQYSMICHGACHFISKILMFIFI